MAGVRTRSRGDKPASSDARRGAGAALAAALTAGVLGSGAMPPDTATGAAAQSADQELVAGVAASLDLPLNRTMVPAVVAEAAPALTSVGREAGTAAPPEPSTAVQPAPGPAADEPVAVSALTATGIPDAALRAYRAAAQRLSVSDPQCGLDWSVLAGIGRVESHHGRYGGARLGADATARPHIIGIALDGRPGVARIPDSDGGRLDGDTTFDRAVGPMQFIPGTWAGVAADGDRDGQSSPHDLDDAALAAGDYLCAGQGSLAEPAGARRALLRYNNSSSYGTLVLALAAGYAGTPVGELPPVDPAGSGEVVSAAGPPPASAAPLPPAAAPVPEAVPPVVVAVPVPAPAPASVTPVLAAEDPLLADAGDLPAEEEPADDGTVSENEDKVAEEAAVDTASGAPTETASDEPAQDEAQAMPAESTDEPSESESPGSCNPATDEPATTDEPTQVFGGGTGDATDVPTDDAATPTDDRTGVRTGVPTDDRTGVPTAEPTEEPTDCNRTTPAPTASDEPTQDVGEEPADGLSPSEPPKL